MKREIDGVPFAYESHGEGTPIVFLHGLPTNRRSIVPRIEPLFASPSVGAWRRIYPDLPGVGETPARPNVTDLDGYIDTIAKFIDEETGGKRVALVGFSWGGYFALAYAQRHPERVAGLALVVPGFGEEPKARPPQTVLVDEPGVLEGEPPPIAGLVRSAATVHTKAVRDILKRDVASGSGSVDRAFLGRVLQTRYGKHELVRGLAFGGPALVLSGRQDTICGYVDAREIAESMPRATYAMLDRAGHALAVEQGDLLRAHVGEWLARVREGLGQPYDARQTP